MGEPGSHSLRTRETMSLLPAETPVEDRKEAFEVDDGLAHATNDKPRRRRTALGAGTIAVIAVLAIALGVGLGVGLHHHSTSTATSSSTSTYGSESYSSSIAAAGPGNATQLTTVVARTELVGDADRWLMSSRNFTISSTPTTRYYNWTIDEVLSSPGGMTKPMITINGQSPGVVVEANLGDRLIINIFNNMTNETAIHWHGQYLRGYNFMDGTYSITQCGIPPGGSMTYNWTVQNVGTSWYHAHKLAQYTDGLIGALVFHAPNETAMLQNPYDDDYTFVLNDMYNTVSGALNWRYTAIGTGIDGQPGDEPTPDGGMINGVSQAKCAYMPPTDLVIAERKRAEPALGIHRKSSLRARSTTKGTYYPETNYCGDLAMDYFNVTLAGERTYRLRLINAGTFTDTIFSIDNHTLTIIEVDGISTEPIEVSSVDLAVAQRYSVLVTLNQTAGAYWIRNTLATDQIRYQGPDFNETTLGVLRYEGIDATVMPADLPAPTLDAPDFNPQSSFVPAEAQDALKPTVQQFVQFNMQYTADNNHYMFFNGSSWEPPSPGNALIFDVANDTAANDTLIASGAADQVSFINNDGGVMDLIVNSLDDGSHPFHLHGHTFQVMSQGSGHFNGDSSTLNATNPMRRDTMQIPAYGHVVIRFATDNPGVWALHCHITWHMEIGLLLTITDMPNEVLAFDIPQQMQDMCKVDAAYGW